VPQLVQSTDHDRDPTPHARATEPEGSISSIEGPSKGGSKQSNSSSSSSSSESLPSGSPQQSFEDDGLSSKANSVEASLLKATVRLVLEADRPVAEPSKGKTPSDAVGLIYDPIMEQHICQTGKTLS
jgi:hypothetical protein